MPRSVVRGAHDHPASGAWSLKDRSETDYGPESRGRTVSTHILGLGIVLVGVLLLAIGLIMGLEFPKYVHEKYKENQCVVSPSQDSYLSWTLGTQWNRQVKVFYWTLTNVNEFLYQGATPKFTEIGPYVYTEMERKEEVSFAVTEVSYRLTRNYTFDSLTTASLCRFCTEDDEMSVINPWYLKIVGQSGGETLLAWSYVPKYVMEYLQLFGFALSVEDNIVYNLNISLLGSYSSSTPPQHQQPWSSFSFGSWLNKTSSSSKTLIVSDRKEQPFTFSETIALYRVFSNITLLGGQAMSLPNVTLQGTCEQWAENLCSSSLVKLKNTGVSECGIYFLLKKCPDNNLTNQVKDILHRALCPPGEDSCLNVTDDLLPAYKNVMYDFMTSLSVIVINTLNTSWDLSLVLTKKQSDLALGYDLTGDSVIANAHVPGLLDTKWSSLHDNVGPLWTVLTCLEDRDINNNMVIEEYNNLWSTPPQLLKPASAAHSLSSFTDFGPSCSALSACVNCYSLPNSLNFFLEDLIRPVTFDYNSSLPLSDVTVHKYVMRNDVFSKSDVYQVEEGLHVMTGVTGYLSWVGLPQVLGASSDHVTLQKTQTPEGYSYIAIEPITGRVWNKRTQLQWNVAIGNESALFQGRKISAINLPLPVFWWDRSAVVTSDQVDYYKHLITRLVSASCGGLIGFSVVAILVAILGAIICVFPSKPNRVVPVMEDTVSNLPNGKHF